jgi:phage terminase large subunit-like protein
MASQWSLACPDWQGRIRTGKSLLPPDLPLNQGRADQAVNIFDNLRLPDVPGLPYLRDAAGGWFRDIVRALHGSIGPDGKRHIREVFCLVPKKSSKTSNGAALMLTSLLLNRRPNAEFLLIAPTQPITEIAFRQVVGMIEADERLTGMMHIQVHLKKITETATGSTLQVKSFDPNVLTGVKPAGILVDELHVVSGNANADRVIGQLRGGLVSQPEAFIVFITTQSERPPAGVFKAELDKARAIRDGKRNGSMLPVLYEFPDDIASDQSKWGNPSNWWMVTPNRGRSIEIERLQEEYQTAKDTSEEEFRRWASQHLNLEIGIALRSDRWAGAEFWQARADKSLTLESLLDRSEVAVVGIDGGGLDDLAGLAVLGREKGTRNWLLWSHAWAHQCVLGRRKEIANRLDDFQKEGTLTIIPDESSADIEGIADIVEQVADAGLLPASKAIGVDPAGVNDIVDELELRGFDADPNTGRITGVRQGFYTLNNTTKMAERRLAAGTMIHGGTALMAWCVGNAKVVPRGNAVTIEKQAAGSAKIDPLMAAFNSIALMAMNPESDVGSVYEERGLRFA